MEFDNDAPLNRIEGESIKANSALQDYWLIGGGRSLDKLMALYLSPTDPLLKAPPTKKINTLKTWSQKLHWQARIKRQKEIDDAIALEKFRERHMSADEVMSRLADQARGDIADFADVRDPEDLKELINSPLVKKLVIIKRRNKDDTETIKTVIELYDAQKSLELIGKDHGRFKERLDITSGDEPFGIDDLFRAKQELDKYENSDQDKTTED